LILFAVLLRFLLFATTLQVFTRLWPLPIERSFHSGCRREDVQLSFTTTNPFAEPAPTFLIDSLPSSLPLNYRGSFPFFIVHHSTMFPAGCLPSRPIPGLVTTLYSLASMSVLNSYFRPVGTFLFLGVILFFLLIMPARACRPFSFTFLDSHG